MAKLGKEIESVRYWEQIGGEYATALENPYHQHRLAIILDLIPKELASAGKRVFDFGCGDAILFPFFLQNGAEISGVDISAEMIALARKRLAGASHDASLVAVGGAAQLAQLGSQSLDGLLSFNVLAYLTDEEEAHFYEQANRVVKPGGYLIVTHSNDLFDLFSLNRYTVEFFQKHLVAPAFHDALSSLLTHPAEPENRSLYNVRENPITYNDKLESYGFREVRQGFINAHPAPPPLLGDERAYTDTRNVPTSDRWKLFFTCSTFGSCSIRV